MPSNGGGGGIKNYQKQREQSDWNKLLAEGSTVITCLV